MLRWYSVSIALALLSAVMGIGGAAELRGLGGIMQEGAETFAFSRWPPAPEGIYSSIDFKQLTRYLAEHGFAFNKHGEREGVDGYSWEPTKGARVRGEARIWMFDSSSVARNRFLFELSGPRLFGAMLPQLTYKAPPVGEILAHSGSGEPSRVVVFLKQNVMVYTYGWSRDIQAEDIVEVTDVFAKVVDSFLEQSDVVAAEKLGYGFEVSGLDGPFKVGQPFVLRGEGHRPGEDPLGDNGAQKNAGFHLRVDVLARKLPDMEPAVLKRIDASSFKCVVPRPGFYLVYTSGAWDAYVATEFTETTIYVEKEDE